MCTNRPALIRRARRKLRSHRGFTLAEMLVVVLLVLLVSGIVASTVQLAAKHFRARTQEADAQLLCSALSLFVQNELTYAGEIKTGENNELVSFTDHVQGFGTDCSFVSADGNGGEAPEGRLAIKYNGGDYFEAASAGSYTGHKALRERHEITYENGQANVTIEILDENRHPITANSFAVRPLAP